jgi:hypothetical protein
MNSRRADLALGDGEATTDVVHGLGYPRSGGLRVSVDAPNIDR